MSVHPRYILPIMLVLCFSTSACKSEIKRDSGTQQQITLEGGERKNGAFDVSLEYDADGIGWLAYSRVEIPKFIETHIAKSTNAGRTWTHVASVGESREGSIKVDGKIQKGVWRDETPCLLFDPADKPSRRWKLFSNRYFTTEPFKPQNRLMGDGTIDIKYAASPAGPWSKAECVVGNRADCKLSMKNAHPDVADVRMNTEPGAIIEDGVIYLIMDAGTTGTGLGDWEHYRVILLSSTNHGATWHYVGTLLDHKDAMLFGYRVFTGTSLAKANGRLYVLATPSGGVKKKNQRHDGTMVIEITDINHARIKRNKDGEPIIEKRVEPDHGSGGLADYDEQNTAGGMVFSIMSLFDFPEVFRIYQTGSGITKASGTDKNLGN